MPSFSRRRAIDWWKGGAVLWWDMCDGRRSGKGSPCGAVRWETGRCACWRAVGGWIGGKLYGRVSVKWLKWLFAGFLFYAGVKYLL